MRDPSTLSVEFGQRVHMARLALGLSQDALGARTALARTSIVNIEKGRQGFAVDWLTRLATALEVEAGWLLTGRVYVGGDSFTPLAAWQALQRCEPLLREVQGLMTFAQGVLVPKGPEQ